MPQEQDPYAEFQKQATKPAASSDDPYAEFRKSAEAPPQAATPPAPASSEAPSQTWSEYLQSWVPSTHTVLRSGGALIGGGVGLAGGTVLGTPISGIPGAAAGGAAGASIGESAYQLGQHFARSYPQSQILNRLFPPGDVPLTSGEAASRQAGALAGGALQEGTGAVLSTKFGPALESSALKSASRAIGPSSAQEIRSTREALGTVLRDLPVARNMTSLLDKLQGNLAKEGPELNNLYTSLPPSTNIPGSSQRIIAGLMKLRDRYMEPAVGGTFKPVKGLENVVKGYDDMIREFQGPDLPLQHLRQRRQAWDQLVNWWRKDIARQPASESIYEETANLVRREINQHFPQIAAKNARVAAWKDLVDIANESEPAAWLGGKRVPPSVVGAVGELATGRAPSAFTLGHGAVYASGPLRTIYRTLTAPVKARIADLLANGNVQGAVRVLTAYGSAGIQDLVSGEPNVFAIPPVPVQSRADAFERLGRNPAQPTAPPQMRVTPSGQASGRLRDQAPTPSPSAAELAARRPVSRDDPAERQRENRRAKLQNPIDVMDSSTGVTGQISASAFDPNRYVMRYPNEKPPTPGKSVATDDFVPDPSELQPFVGRPK